MCEADREQTFLDPETKLPGPAVHQMSPDSPSEALNPVMWLCCPQVLPTKRKQPDPIKLAGQEASGCALRTFRISALWSERGRERAR